MEKKRIMLWSPGQTYPGDKVEFENGPYLEVWPVSGASGAVIVCPGGGYSHLAPHEGAPIAERINRSGIAAFVLRYRLAPDSHHPAQLYDAARAIRMVRSGAADWGIDSDKIAILGFSAGGHFAAHIGTGFSGVPEDPVYPVSCRPDAIISCYAVINSHTGSYKNLLGDAYDPEAVCAVRPDLLADKNTPPAFIWHTAEDAVVPVGNALDFGGALSKAGVPFELHVFPYGAHGIGLAAGNTASVWPELCVKWLRSMGW